MWNHFFTKIDNLEKEHTSTTTFLVHDAIPASSFLISMLYKLLNVPYTGGGVYYNGDFNAKE